MARGGGGGNLKGRRSGGVGSFKGSGSPAGGGKSNGNESHGIRGADQADTIMMAMMVHQEIIMTSVGLSHSL